MGQIRHATLYHDPDGLAASFDAARGLLPEAIANQICDRLLYLIEAKPSTRFLEPGAGTGRIGLPFVLRGYSYTGVDTSREMINAFRAKVSGVPTQLRLVRADVTSLPFGDARFDVVLAVHLLYLVPGWQRALTEIRRVLVPNGLFIHCDEDADLNGPARELNYKWQEILAKLGYEALWKQTPGAGGQEILRVLAELGATIESGTVAEWRIDRSLPEYLGTYASKVRPLYPHIPSDRFQSAVDDFRYWARHRYPDSMLHSCNFSFKAHVARF